MHYYTTRRALARLKRSLDADKAALVSVCLASPDMCAEVAAYAEECCEAADFSVSPFTGTIDWMAIFKWIVEHPDELLAFIQALIKIFSGEERSA